MVRFVEHGVVAVVNPSMSLLVHMGGWLHDNRTFQLRLVPFRQGEQIQEVLDAGDIAIIDGSEDPAAAAAVLERCLETIGAENTAVFSERAHDALEVFTREQGVLYVLDPATPVMWQGFFDWLHAAERRSRGIGATEIGLAVPTVGMGRPQ